MEVKTQADLESLIANQVPEGQRLDYKAAASLDKDGVRKDEAIRDVTALANAAGGMIIYGIREDKQVNQPGMPVALDPVTNLKFNRDWYVQVINKADPEVLGVDPYPIPLAGGFALVVPVPQSTRAHMARDFRYYRRVNSENVPMTDDQVLDVRNRSLHPVVEVHFRRSVTVTNPVGQVHAVKVITSLANLGTVVAHHYMMDLFFPDLADYAKRFLNYTDPAQTERRMKFTPSYQDRGHVHLISAPSGYKGVRVISDRVLFPTEVLDLNHEILIEFPVDNDIRTHRKKIPNIRWVLFADNMPRREVEVPFSTFLEIP